MLRDKKQSGGVTLLFVSALVLVMGLFSFAVLTSAKDHSKKMQNYLLALKDKAHANASLLCALAVFRQQKIVPDTLNKEQFSECKTVPEVVFSFFKHNTYWQFTASKGFAKASSLIAYSEPWLGALSVAGDVTILHGNTWYPATINRSNKNAECISILATGNIEVDLTAAIDDFVIATSNSIDCVVKPTYIKAGEKLATAFSDINAYQTELEIFKEVFHVNKSNWQQIKAQFEQIIITGSAIDTPDSVKQCGSHIKQALLSGKALIWVEGDCILDGLNNYSSAFQSPLIIIKNGIVSANVPFSAKATIFQIVIAHPDGNFSRSFGAKASKQCTDGAMKKACQALIETFDASSALWASLPFYFPERFYLEGSYWVDAEDSTVLIDTEFSLGFDAKLTQHSLIKGEPQILKGSLHDF